MFGNEIVVSGGGGSPISTGVDNGQQLGLVRANLGEIQKHLAVPMNPTTEDIESLSYESGQLEATIELTKRQSALQLDVATKNVQLSGLRLDHAVKSLGIQNKYTKQTADGLNKAGLEMLTMGSQEKKFQGFTSMVNNAVKLLKY